MKNENGIKYFAYLRKSTESEDRQVQSIESQRDEMNKIIKDNKLNVVEFIDESFTAKKPGRKKFNEMIERISNGEANGILTWNPNRISRNSVDTGSVIYLFDQGVLKEIKTPTQTFKNDPNDKFLLSLFCSQAKLENDNKGVDVKRGMRKKAELGWFPGPAKPGYLNEKYAEKGYKEILVDPIRFTLIQKAFQTILSRKHSPARVLDLLNNEWGYTTPMKRRLGGKPMRKSQFYKMLTDIFYYGYYEHGGIIYKGKHQPMITKAEFEELQTTIGHNQTSPNKAQHNEAFYGDFKCGECGGYMTPDVKIQTICSNCKNKFSSRHKDHCPECMTKIFEMTNPKQLRYVYYNCKGNKNPNCSQRKVIREDEVINQFTEILKGIKISEKMTQWFVKQLNKINNAELKDQVCVTESLTIKRDDITKRKHNLLQMKISPQNTNGQMLNDTDFITQNNALDKEIELIDQNIANSHEKSKLWAELTIDTFNFACYAPYHFENGDYETRKSILLGFGSNITIKDSKVSVILPEHLEIIKKVNNLVKSRKEIFEPKEKLLHKEKTASFETAFPTWHGQ